MMKLIRKNKEKDNVIIETNDIQIDFTGPLIKIRLSEWSNTRVRRYELQIDDPVVANVLQDYCSALVSHYRKGMEEKGE